MWHVQSGHRDVVVITDENGNVLNTYEYDSYGNVISANETYHNSLRYCGEIQGIYGDLVYLRNRIYNPEIKRFLTEDPIMDGSNWYVYCNNNPINFWDPLGLDFDFNSMDDFILFQKYTSDIYGASVEDLEWEYEFHDNGKVTLTGVSGYDVSSGSKTGIATLNSLIEDDELSVTVNFDRDKGDAASDSAAYMRIGIEQNTREIQASLIHESVHIYTSVKGYDRLIEENVDVAYGVDVNAVKRGYREATAITVEEQFRQEMGYSSRDPQNGAIGDDLNSYGCWPQSIPQMFKGGYGVSLLQSRYVWIDIQKNYYGDNYWR